MLYHSETISQAIKQLYSVIKSYGDLSQQGYLLIDTGYMCPSDVDNISWLIISGLNNY